MKRLKTGFMALGAALTIFCANAQAQDPIKIGFVASMSGPMAGLGRDLLDGFKLLIEQNDGKLGERTVQLFVEDSQLKPDVALQAVDRMVERDKVPIVVGFTFSNELLVAYRKVVNNDVFLIGTSAGPSSVAGADCSPNFFSTSAQNNQQAEVVGRYATESGLKRVITVAPNYQAGQDLVTGFKRYFEGDIVDELWPALNTLDFAADIAQIAAARPDGVFLFLPGALGIGFIKQWEQAGMRGKIPLLTASTTEGTTLPAMGESALGVLSGSFWGPDFSNAQNRKFMRDFESKHGRIASQYAAQTYDAAQLIDAALRKTGGDIDDKDAFRSALASAPFDSVRGDFEYGNNHFPVQDLHVFEVVKDDKGRLTLETLATPLKDARDAYHEQCPMAG